MKTKLMLLTVLIAAFLVWAPARSPFVPLVEAQNTALNRTTGAILTNKSGGSVAYGAVVVLDNTNTNGFTTTTTGALSTRGIGVVLEVNGIANNASGFVATAGWIPKITLNTAATMGQFLKTHTVAGQATPHSSPQVEGDFGVALEASSTPRAILFGAPNAPGLATSPAGSSGDLQTNNSGSFGAITPGSGISTWLATPSGANLASALTTALPDSKGGTGITALGTGVATALAVAVGTDGAPVVNGGALGTPSSGTGTNLTGIPATTGLIGVPGNICEGRLTTESGVPVSTSDRTAQGTLYFTPSSPTGTAIGTGLIALYNGSTLVLKSFTELSLALTLTSGKNYDVFIDYNSGTPQIVLSAAWTNDTTRADALATQAGIVVKSGTTAYRWVGTIRASATDKVEDSGGITGTTQVGGKRFVWNAYNQVPRQNSVVDKTDSWSYTTNTVRQAGGASGNKVEYVTGSASALVSATVLSGVTQTSSTTNTSKVGVGLDSTTTFSGLVGSAFNGSASAIAQTISGAYKGQPGLGYHYLSWNEVGAGGTNSFLGDNGGDGSQSGLTVDLLN